MSKYTYDNIDIAEAQFLGFNAGLDNGNIVSLSESMALEKFELDEIVKRYPSTLSEEQVAEITEALFN